MYLFDLASRHMTWLAERQALTATNIANADTPGYRAQDAVPFTSFLEGPELQMATTSPLHMTSGPSDAPVTDRGSATSWGSSHSGNDVSIEQELMTASADSRMMNVDAGITRSFQRMLLSAVKA